MRKEEEEDGDKLEKILSSPHLAPPDHEQRSPHNMSLFPYYCQQFPAFTGLIFGLGALAKYPCRREGLAGCRRHGRRREKRRVRKEKRGETERGRDVRRPSVTHSLSPQNQNNEPNIHPEGFPVLFPLQRGSCGTLILLRGSTTHGRVCHTGFGVVVGRRGEASVRPARGASKF